jgi:hypothetical protein
MERKESFRNSERIFLIKVSDSWDIGIEGESEILDYSKGSYYSGK